MSQFPQSPLAENNNGNFKFGIILIAVLLVVLIVIFGVYSWRSSRSGNVAQTQEKVGLLDRLLGGSATSVTIASADADRDGLDNKTEQNVKTDPAKVDTDSDGLSDREEALVYKTNPTVPDSDNDGMNDGDEIDNRRDPLNADPKAEWPPRPNLNN